MAYFVYILSNKRRTVYYVGVTSRPEERLNEHAFKIYANSFTAKYNVNELLYFEEFEDINDAIRREKEIKKWRREKKLGLIKNANPTLKNILD